MEEVAKRPSPPHRLPQKRKRHKVGSFAKRKKEKKERNREKFPFLSFFFLSGGNFTRN